MTDRQTPDIEGLKKLREPFGANHIRKLPKETRKQIDERKADDNCIIFNCPECGGHHHKRAVHLDYVGHAALTSRLLEVDPLWTWEPLALDERGWPRMDAQGGLWIKLTVCGHTRLGFGDSGGKTGPDGIKEAIGDALRNAAMRFGAALEFWHKGDLHGDEPKVPEERGDPEDAAPPAKPPYPDAQFRDNLPTWESAVLKDGKTPEAIINTISSKFTLSDEQVTKIRNIKKGGEA